MNSGNINWAKLKDQGRVRDFGQPWTDAESLALLNKEVTVEDLRSGKVKLSDEATTEVADASKDVDAPEAENLSKLKKADLVKKAADLGIEVASDATKDQIIEAINAKGAEEVSTDAPTDTTATE